MSNLRISDQQVFDHCAKYITNLGSNWKGSEERGWTFFGDGGEKCALMSMLPASTTKNTILHSYFVATHRHIELEPLEDAIMNCFDKARTLEEYHNPNFMQHRLASIAAAFGLEYTPVTAVNNDEKQALAA